MRAFLDHRGGPIELPLALRDSRRWLHGKGATLSGHVIASLHLLLLLWMLFLLLLEVQVMMVLDVLMVNMLLVCLAPTVSVVNLLLRTGLPCTRRRAGDLRLSMRVRCPSALPQDRLIPGLRSGMRLLRRVGLVPLQLATLLRICTLRHGRVLGGRPHDSTRGCYRLRTVLTPMSVLLHLQLRVMLLALLRPLLVMRLRLLLLLLSLRAR